MARPRLGPDTLDLLNLVHGRPETLAVDCTSDGSPWTPSSASLIVYRSTAPDTPVATITAIVTTGTATFDLSDVTDLAVGSYTGELVVNGGSAAKGMIEVRAKGDGRGRTSGTRTVSLTLVDGATTITLDIAAVPSAGGGGGGGATNLAYVSGATSGTVTSDTGTDATIPAATGSIAGLMVPAQFTALAGLASTYQPLDSDLTAIAALTTTTFGRALLTQADAAAARSTLGLGTAATTNASAYEVAGAAAAAQAASQPLDSDLTAIAALSTTTYGRAFLALADAAAGRTALGLGGSAVLNVGTSAGTVAAGDDSRLSDARTPTAHATTHQSGGADAIKLDDLATPDDNTDLDATTTRHGLLPKLGGGTTNFLRADGAWAAPSGGGGGGIAAGPRSIWELDALATGAALHFPLGFPASPVAATAGDEYWIPVELPRGFDASGLAINCTTVGAGSIARLALYNSTSGLPGTLIEDNGTVDTATSTGVKTASFAATRTLAAGHYFAYVKVTGGAPTLSCASATATAVPWWLPMPSAFSAIGGSLSSGLRRAGQSAGAAPSPAPTLGISDVNRFMPIVALIAA